MKANISKVFNALLLSAALSAGVTVAVAQDTTNPGFKQDMKAAGHNTIDAAKDTGNGVKSGTQKAWHSTKHETKKATHKVAHKTDQGARKVERKTQPQ